MIWHDTQSHNGAQQLKKPHSWCSRVNIDNCMHNAIRIAKKICTCSVHLYHIHTDIHICLLSVLLACNHACNHACMHCSLHTCCSSSAARPVSCCSGNGEQCGRICNTSVCTLLNTQTANKADLLPVLWVVGNEVDLMLVSSWQVKWRWHKILL